MLTISAYFLLVLAIAGGILLVTFLYRSINNKTGFEEEDEKYSDLDLAIGNLVRIDQKYLDRTSYLIESSDFVEIILPNKNTKENEIRVDVGILGVNIPKNKIIEVKDYSHLDREYKPSKQNENLFDRHKDDFSQDIISQLAVAQIIDNSYDGNILKITEAEAAVIFGHGGEFGGGGASGSWEESKRQDNVANNGDPYYSSDPIFHSHDDNQTSTYETASNTSDYSSSSSDNSSDSSSSDSSSDSGSSND